MKQPTGLYIIACHSAKILINEINTDTPECLQANEFIEIALFNDSDEETATNERELNGYFVAVMTPYFESLKAPAILLLADLSGHRFDADKKYFVIGGPAVNPSISFLDPAVQSHSKLKDSLYNTRSKAAAALRNVLTSAKY